MVHKKSPRIVVAGLIKKGHKYLLVKETLESGKDIWIIPGGGVEFGETLEQALVREMNEELGIKIQVPQFIMHKEAIFPDFNYHAVVFFYQITSQQDINIVEKKILEAKFFSMEQLNKLPLVESAQWLFKDMGILE